VCPFYADAPSGTWLTRPKWLPFIAPLRGQIVFLAKHLQHANWRGLSIPRHQSAEFNRMVARGEASQR
jgi:hypothetical protein